MRQKYLEILISFFIGLSWSVSVFLAAYLFFIGLHFGLLAAIFLGFLGACVGMLFVAFFEGLSLLQDIAAQKREQTKLLNEILSKLSSEKKPSDEEIPNN